MNFDASRGADEQQPEMLSRFLDGLLHPMIHTGNGVEFGIPGILIEGGHYDFIFRPRVKFIIENQGLASTAVHTPGSSAVLPASSFEGTTSRSWISRLFSALNLTWKGSSSPSKNTHALTILARVLKDPRFEIKEDVDDFEIYGTTMTNHGEAIRKYASEWSYDSSDPVEVERKIEELVWMNVIIYGVGGWREGSGGFNADFFYMHLVTSSIFLSSLTVHLKPSSQELLLRSYFAVSLSWYIAHGRPSLDIAGFFAADTAYPTPPWPLPIPDKEALPEQSSLEAVTPNPWLPIIQTTIVHPSQHLPKLQRALVHYGALYGMRPPGLPDFAETELPGADKLDGTLFIRVSGLTAKRMGRVRDGEAPLRFWDRRWI